MKLLNSILIAVLLVSCGARKSQVTKQDIQIEETTKVSEQLSIISENSETLIDTSSTTEYFFEPIDETLPFIVKGQTYKNVRVTSKKSKNGISISKSKDTVLNQRKYTLNEVLVDIQSKDKETITKNRFPWWLILVIIIIGYSKYKKIW